MERLHKAREDLGARRDANKARYDDDVKEIDRLVEEQHHLQETDVQDEVCVTCLNFVFSRSAA